MRDLLLTKVETPIARGRQGSSEDCGCQGGEIERLEKWRPLEVTSAALATFHYVHGDRNHPQYAIQTLFVLP